MLNLGGEILCLLFPGTQPYAAYIHAYILTHTHPIPMPAKAYSSCAENNRKDPPF